jgi:hypothetical protein
MGHTEKTTEEHPLVLNGGYSSFAVRHCFRLKIGWEIDEGSNKSVNGACELLRRLRVVNKHWGISGQKQMICAAKGYPLLCQVLAATQTTSRLFSWWFTMVRTLRLITVSGGVSFGALWSVSGKGFMSLGSDTVASSLHQENWQTVNETTIFE